MIENKFLSSSDYRPLITLRSLTSDYFEKNR